MLDAVRYVVDNGVKWVNLPCDFPPYRRVHTFARRWQVTGLLAEFHDRLRDKVRQKEGRSPDPTAAIVDSQSLRAACRFGHRPIPYSTGHRDTGWTIRAVYLRAVTHSHGTHSTRIRPGQFVQRVNMNSDLRK